MVDLTLEMAALAERLGPPPGERARLIQFVSAEPGEGTSTVAREFARAMSAGAQKGVWLVDLDLLKGDQFDEIASHAKEYGPLGAPVRASPNQTAFFSVTPSTRNRDGRPWPDASYLAAYAVGGRRWWVTRFRKEALKPGQHVDILAEPAYWDSLRRHADYVVVDAPALSRSRAAVALAPLMDATVMVVAADAKHPESHARLRDALKAVGARCPGVFLNRAPADPPGFLSALAR